MISINDKYPLVSIVVPTLNRKKDIIKCFDSIRRLDYPKKYLEVIVWDNGSSDGTQAEINKIFAEMKKGKIVFQQDHEPAYGLYQTSEWKENERISEIYWLELPITVLPGIYHIYAGIGDKITEKTEYIDETPLDLKSLKKVGTINVQKF